MLVAVWAISGLYVANGMLRGWVPHDEGRLGQSAERILVGELPHRDFDDPYTGGLSYLRVRAGALNRAPEFSGAPPLDLAAALVQRAHAMVIGKFEVRWIE
jgi:hypothetical protein